MKPADMRIDVTVTPHIAFRGDGSEFAAPAFQLPFVLQREERAHVCDSCFLQPGGTHHFRTSLIAGIEDKNRAREAFRHTGEQAFDILRPEIIEYACREEHSAAGSIHGVHPARIIEVAGLDFCFKFQKTKE